MFSIDLPTWLGDIVGPLAGGTWPKEHEGDFAAVSDIWSETTGALGGFGDELNNARQAMQEGLSGPTAEQFGEFIDNLQSALPQMQQGTQSLSQLAMETAENIQYAKLMMLSMLVVTAVTIAELADSVFGAPAIPAVEAAAEAVMESIASQLIKQVLKSAAEAAAMQTAIDSGIQLFQYLKYGKPWNWKQTVESAGLGALGGALGAGLGFAALKGLGEDIGNSFTSHVIQGALNGAVVTEIGNAINGSDSNVGLGAVGGAFGGAVGHAAHALGGPKPEPNPEGYHFEDPTFGNLKGGGESGGKFNGGDDDPGGGPNPFSTRNGSDGAPNPSSTRGGSQGGPDGFSIHEGSVSGGSVEGGSVHGGGETGGQTTGGSVRGGGETGGQTTGGSSSGGGSRVNEPPLSSEDPTGYGSPVPSSPVSSGPDLRGSGSTETPQGVSATRPVGAGSDDLTEAQTVPPPISASRDQFSTPAPSSTTTATGSGSGSGSVVSHESDGNPVETVATPHSGGVQGLPGFETVTDRPQPPTIEHAEPPQQQPQVSAPPVQRPSLKVSIPESVSPVERSSSPEPISPVSPIERPSSTAEPVSPVSPVSPIERPSSTVEPVSQVSPVSPIERPSSTVPSAQQQVVSGGDRATAPPPVQDGFSQAPRPEQVAPSGDRVDTPVPNRQPSSSEPTTLATSQDPSVDTSRPADQPTDTPTATVGDRPSGTVSTESDVPDTTITDTTAPDTTTTDTTAQAPPIRTSEPSVPSLSPSTPRPARESLDPSASGEDGHSGGSVDQVRQPSMLSGIDREHGPIRLGSDEGDHVPNPSSGPDTQTSRPPRSEAPGGTGGVRRQASPASLGADIGHALRSSDSNFVGRAYTPDRGQQARLAAHFSRSGAGLRGNDIMHVERTPQGLKVVATSKAPWSDERGVYVAQVHQSRGVFTVPLGGGGRGDSGRIDGGGLGKGLTRRPSLSSLDDDAPVVLVSCASGRPIDDGPAPAQLVADETGRRVYAPTTDVYVSEDGLALADDAQGRPGQWLEFQPGGDRPNSATGDLIPVDERGLPGGTSPFGVRSPAETPSSRSPELRPAPGHGESADSGPASPHDQPDPSQAAKANLALSHLAVAARDPQVREMMQDATAGAFTSRRGDGGIVRAPNREALDQLVRKTADFNDLASRLPRDGREPITVYRAVQMPGDQRGATDFVERLPSSTSFNLDTVKDWTNNRGGSDNYAIFEIKVPPEHGAMAQGYPKGYEPGAEDPRAVNQLQEEVTISPTRLSVTGHRTDPDGTRLIQVDAKQLSPAETDALIRDTGPAPSMSDMFDNFKDFYTQSNIRRSYWFDLHDAKFSVQSGGNEHTVTITRPGSDDSLTVNVRHDPDTDKITVQIKPSDGSGEQNYEYGPDNIRQIAAQLTSRNLHQSESFDSLPMPSRWYEMGGPERNTPQSSPADSASHSPTATTSRSPFTDSAPDVSSTPRPEDVDQQDDAHEPGDEPISHDESGTRGPTGGSTVVRGAGGRAPRGTDDPRSSDDAQIAAQRAYQNDVQRRQAEANGNGGSQRPSSDALAAAARAMGAQRDGGGRMLDGLGGGGAVRMSSEPDDVDTQVPHDTTEAAPSTAHDPDTADQTGQPRRMPPPPRVDDDVDDDRDPASAALPSTEPADVRTSPSPRAPEVPTESSGGRGRSPGVVDRASDAQTAPRSAHARAETRPDERAASTNGHGAAPHRGDDPAGHGRPGPAAPSGHTGPSGLSRREQWEDAKVEIQQHFTDRFDYTVKTERVADEAEDHFQEALTDRDILRSRAGQDPDDLSQSGQDKVLGDFKADVKAAFDDRFGTPDDRYDTAIDHANAFRGQLDTLARELPARLDREALWEQQREQMRARFDEAFDTHPNMSARRELFGRWGIDRLDTQRNEAWERFEPELRSAFDETAARTSPSDLASAVAARFDELVRDQIPKGIALHDRLLTEVSAGRAAAGEEHPAVHDAVEQRIRSEFESVFGRPFAARPDDSRPDEDDFDRNDRWEQFKQDGLPKAVALAGELGPGFADRFDTAVVTHAAPRARLGLSLERPTGNAQHGLTYDAAFGRASAGADGHDGGDAEDPSAAAAHGTDGWLPGRDLSDAGLQRARSAFADELAAAFHEHFDRPATDTDRDGPMADAYHQEVWQNKREALFAERLPKLMEYEAAYERHLDNASRDFEDSYDAWEEDFAGGGHLQDDGIERVRAKFDEDFRSAYDQVHRADPDRWDGVGGPDRAWQAVSQRLLGDVGRRFEAEEALVDEAGRAADRFDRLGGEFQVQDEHRQDLGSAYWTETATRHDQLFGDGTRDVAAWLQHEKEHGDAFGSRLAELSDQREAAAAAAAKAQAERAAAEAEAARAAEAGGPGHHGEDAGHDVRQVHEEAPPETGAEKLQRLTAENDAKVESDVQQLTQTWRDAGHTDAVIEQAAKAWTDTVRREFGSFHHGLVDNGRVLTGGRWEDKYDNLRDIADSGQWIGVHKQVGDALSVLEDGLKQRTEEWSGSRYSDWQRDQLAYAGQRLASGMRSELSKQLGYLQVGRVGAVADDTRRQWTAEAVTKGFDGVLDHLRRSVDTSPVLMASLARLRTETVSALDAPGHPSYLHVEPEPDVSGLSQDEQWQQARTQLDTQYAQRLDFLAKLESKRPDADEIFSRVVGAARDRSYDGNKEYEQMLPDSEEFRQAVDGAFDRTFAPSASTRSAGGGMISKSAEQRWNQQRELLENSLASRVRLAAKHTELDEQAARTEQATREKWTSEQAADEKIIDQTLKEFRANQKNLFLGTYGRLDPVGKIDVNASFTYRDAYHSLVEKLDRQLAAAVARDTATKAASAQYDEAVNAWRQSRGSALSSFEPDLTVGLRHPSPEHDVEYAPDPEAQFDAAFAAQAASASARHLNQLRTEMIDARQPGQAHQPSYTAGGRPRGASADLNAKLDLEGRFVEAMPRLREGIAQVARGTSGLDERAAQELVKSSVDRADAVFQRIARGAGDPADAGEKLQRELDDVIAGTKAVAEFQAAVSERVQAFAENSDEQISAQAAAQVMRWAHNAAAAKFDQLLDSGGRTGEARLNALSNRLDEVLTEIDGRLGFEAGAQKAISAANEKAAQIAEENLHSSGTVLDPDSVQRIRLQHVTAALEAADKLRGDLAAHHFDPGQSRQVIEELDDTLRHLVDGVPQQLLVETRLTSALTDAGHGFAALTDAHDVPIRTFAGAARDYHSDYMTARIRTYSEKPLDAPSWLEHESATADRFGTALHAPVREVYSDVAWQPEEQYEQQDEAPWRKSTFSPVGADAACVEAAVVHLRRRRAPDLLGAEQPSYTPRLPAPSQNGSIAQ